MRRMSAFVALGLLPLLRAGAQDRCLTQVITERWLRSHHLTSDLSAWVRAHSTAATRGGTPTVVPVVVHVVWNTPPENIPSSAIEDMIATMNEDFNAVNADWNNARPEFIDDRADAAISFCLASTDPNGAPTNGITRTETTETWFDPETETDDMKSPPKGIAAWDPASYMNIWICDISSGLGGGLVTTGYSYLPFGVAGTDVDGPVIDYAYGIGTGNRTATHEAGHYLGLLHPWSNGGCGSDDGMDDTPVTDGPTFSCANTALMNCGELTQFENFMDYSDCPLMFTHDQTTMMASVLQNERLDLLSSDACSTNSSAALSPLRIMSLMDGSVQVDPRGTGAGTLIIADGQGRIVRRIGVPAEGSTEKLPDLATATYAVTFINARMAVTDRWTSVAK